MGRSKTVITVIFMTVFVALMIFSMVWGYKNEKKEGLEMPYTRNMIQTMVRKLRTIPVWD